MQCRAKRAGKEGISSSRHLDINSAMGKLAQFPPRVFLVPPLHNGRLMHIYWSTADPLLISFHIASVFFSYSVDPSSQTTRRTVVT